MILFSRVRDCQHQTWTTAAFRMIGDCGSALCVIAISGLVLARVIQPSLVTRRLRQTSLALVILTSLLLLSLILVPSTVINGYLGVTDTGVWYWIVDMNKITAGLHVGTEYALFD